MMLPITATFIALLALLQVPMTFAVGLARIPNTVHFYDEGDIKLRRRQRAHANFTENAPIFLLALAAAELSGGNTALLWSLGAVFVLGRLLHYAVLLIQGWGNGRAFGMVLTLAPIAVLAVTTLVNLNT